MGKSVFKSGTVSREREAHSIPPKVHHEFYDRWILAGNLVRISGSGLGGSWLPSSWNPSDYEKRTQLDSTSSRVPAQRTPGFRLVSITGHISEPLVLRPSFCFNSLYFVRTNQIRSHVDTTSFSRICRLCRKCYGSRWRTLVIVNFDQASNSRSPRRNPQL